MSATKKSLVLTALAALGWLAVGSLSTVSFRWDPVTGAVTCHRIGVPQ